MMKIFSLIGLSFCAFFISFQGAAAQNLYGANCPGYAARSPTSNAKLSVTFKNSSPVNLDVYWVDFRGGLKLYRTLQRGQSYNVNTYRGHIWLVWDGFSNKCNLWFTASRNETWTLR